VPDRDPLNFFQVAESDRAQVLDGIIEYPGELVIVIENKVADTEAEA
jgi:hypothetical protein